MREFEIEMHCTRGLSGTCYSGCVSTELVVVLRPSEIASLNIFQLCVLFPF